MLDNITVKIRQLVPLFLLTELVSFLGFYWPVVSKLAFLIFFAIAIYLGAKKYYYLLALLFAELIIGSKGYLFFYLIGGFSVSIRMVFWLVVMTVWSVGLLKNSIKAKSIDVFKNELVPKNIFKFLPLVFAVALSFSLAFLYNNNLNFIYRDGNNWLYLLLIWPVATTVRGMSREDLNNFGAVIMTAVSWLVIKTWILLYFFAHDFPILPDLYRWVRTSGVGEITELKASFYRIFIQSHIFVVIALIVTWYILAKTAQKKPLREIVNDKKVLLVLVISSSLLSVVLIGLSRSFWVSLLVVFVIQKLYLLFDRSMALKVKFFVFWRYAALMISSLSVALFILFIVIKIPIPRNTLEFNTANVLSERATETNESAIGSRWALLPVLWNSIKPVYFFGAGFGKTVTYETQDPRAVKANGKYYTTFAFEWGWLDFWLKMGLIGVLSYLFLFYSILDDTWTTENRLLVILLVACLVVVHIFTPYLNHPLGIGALILIVSYFQVAGASLSSEDK